MIGLVVVSHGRALASAAVDLATALLPKPQARIVIAAGLTETEYGTDAVAVATAIQAADSGDGVLVLMDLGSAVLSAETALDLLESPHRVRLCAAPLVEGLVAALAAADGGADLDKAAHEADHALDGKRAQLGETPTPPPDEPTTAVIATPPTEEPGAAGINTPPAEAHPVSELSAPPIDVPEIRRPEPMTAIVEVTNAHGLHARPAAELVSALGKLDAEVRLRNASTGAGPVPGNSLTRVLTLGILPGHRLEVSATGPDSAAAVEYVRTVATNH
ncbi:HPr family phosphocarrier protein [Nocardia sp. 2]|uniref:Phosphocarrier protein HPr n=1 Tax=Nocardia acididurans TaxID=2802282 RepID=A0ABS1LXM1_9NOCA|nr:dihydroxyacetone kinase phosphoryl donor subunit DhaM [Nocardia acididurans]MBL1073108.1 HPr family phosphocarrier protein [Nocardia acididurans]